MILSARRRYRGSVAIGEFQAPADYLLIATIFLTMVFTDGTSSVTCTRVLAAWSRTGKEYDTSGICRLVPLKITSFIHVTTNPRSHIPACLFV